MTLELRYAVRSDVGLLREGNEDSAYAGPRLLAVADGMGGHAAGEVASALTIASMAELDAEQVSGDMLKVLAMAPICFGRGRGRPPPPTPGCRRKSSPTRPSRAWAPR
jgi:hypothetical protein